jgi:hypothetical protein
VRLLPDTTIIPPDRSARLRAAKRAGMPAGAVLLYLELARVQNLKGSNRWLRAPDLAEALDEPERNIRFWLKWLTDAGLVERECGTAACVPPGNTLPEAAFTNGNVLPKKRQPIAGKRQPIAARPHREPVQHAAVSSPKEEGTRKNYLPTHVHGLGDHATAIEGGQAQAEPLSFSSVVPRDHQGHQAGTDHPGQTSDVPPPATLAAAEMLLDGFFASPVLTAAQHHRHLDAYRKRREYWLETLPPAFIGAVIRHARFGEGVRRDCFGAVVTWLERPELARDAIPAAAAALREANAALRVAIPAATAPEPGVKNPGWHRGTNGRVWNVLEVYDEIAVIEGLAEPLSVWLTQGWQPIPSGGSA